MWMVRERERTKAGVLRACMYLGANGIDGRRRTLWPD